MAELKQDDLDRGLHAALAKYAAVEPRAGLEQRVLANLHAQRATGNTPGWRWSIIVLVATVVIVAIALTWRSGRPSPPVVANHSSPTTQVPQKGPQIVLNGGETAIRPHGSGTIRRTAVYRSPSKAVRADHPKLDQFPSPQPLSEQEKILANYVARYPEHAALIAEARTEALRRDRAEEMRDVAADEQDSPHQDR